MAVDRNTIVTLNKNGESNFCIAKKLHIRRETLFKVVKKFEESSETCNRKGQGRIRTVRTKRLVKNTREKLRRNSRRFATKMAAEAGISQTSMRQILKDLRTYPYKMQKTHELLTTHDRMRLDGCQHILNNLFPFTSTYMFDILNLNIYLNICRIVRNKFLRWPRTGGIEYRKVDSTAGWRQIVTSSSIRWQCSDVIGWHSQDINGIHRNNSYNFEAKLMRLSDDIHNFITEIVDV